MKRRFTAEITFSGLILVDVRKPGRVRENERGPRTARDVRVLLVDSEERAARACHEEPAERDQKTGERHACHRHYPRLTYFAEDDLSLAPGTPIAVSPDGRETVSVSLDGMDVEVEAPYPYERSGRRHVLSWMEGELARKALRRPETRYEERFLDWSIQNVDIGLDSGHIEPVRATSCITLPPGAWQSKGVVRNREVASLAPYVWEVVDGSGEVTRTQALSRSVSVRLEGLRYGLSVQIGPRHAPANREIVLVPGPSDELKLAITNLPDRTPVPDESHLPMFARLTAAGTGLDRSRIAIVDHVTCQSSATVCEHMVRTS